VHEKRIKPVPGQDKERFDRQRRAGIAIPVGVGDYPPFSGFGELPYPSADAEQLAAELEKPRYLVISLKESDAPDRAD
jgi:hypothetical protein